MARLQDTQIVFQIKGDNKDVLAKIQEAAKEKAKFEASGESTVKMVVDKNGIADVQEIFSQIKADGENIFKMLFDGDATKKLLGGTVEEIEAKFEKISKIAADFLNNMQFVGTSAPGANADYFAKQEQAAKKLEDRLKSLKKQQAEYFKKTMADPLSREMSGKGTDRDLAKLKTLYDFAKQSGMDKELKDHKWNAVDYRGKKQEYSFKDIGSYLKGTSVDRDMMQKYKEAYIKESLSDVNNAISKILQHKNYLSTSDLDSIIQTDNYNLKDILSRAQKYKKANPSGYASVVSDDGGASQGSSGENPITDPNKPNILKTQDVDVNLIVKDEQLSTLREKIKTAASDIPVTISSVQTKDGLTLDIDANVKSVNKKDEKVVQTEQPTLANATFEDLKKTLSDVQIKVDDQDALSKIDNIKTKLENAVDVQIKITDAVVQDGVESKIQGALNQNEFKVNIKNDAKDGNGEVDLKDGKTIELFADLKLVDGQPESLKSIIESGLKDISINIKNVTLDDNIGDIISKKLSKANAIKIPDNAPEHIKNMNPLTGFSKDESALVKEIVSFYSTYKDKYKTKEDSDLLYNEMFNLLEESIDSGKSLDRSQISNFVAMVRRYKYITNEESPIKEMMTELGMSNQSWDSVIGGYGTAKDLYEKFITQSNEIAKFRNQSSGFDLKVKVSNDSVSQIKSTINSILNPQGGHEINLSTVSGLENLTQALANAIGSGAAQGNNKAEAEAQETLATYKELDVMMDRIVAKKDVYENSKKYYEYLANFNDQKMKYTLPKGLDGKMLRNGYSTEAGIKKAIKEYNKEKESGNQEKIEESEKKLIALTSAYYDVEKAADVFGDKNKTLWTEIKNKIDLAKKSKEMWQKIHMQAGSINQKAGSIIGQKNIGMTSIDIARMLIGSGGKEALWKALDQNGLDSSILFGKEKSAEKVDGTVKLALDPDSKGSVQSEVNAMFTNVPLTVKFENIETIQSQLDTLFKNITLEIGNIKWSGNTLSGVTTQTPIVEQPTISTDNIVTSTQSGDVQVPATVETVKIEELPQKTEEIKQQVETPMVVNIETNEAEERVNGLRESIIELSKEYQEVLLQKLNWQLERFYIDPDDFVDHGKMKYSDVLIDEEAGLLDSNGELTDDIIKTTANIVKDLLKKEKMRKKTGLTDQENDELYKYSEQLAHMVYARENVEGKDKKSTAKLIGNKNLYEALQRSVDYDHKYRNANRAEHNIVFEKLPELIYKYTNKRYALGSIEDFETQYLFRNSVPKMFGEEKPYLDKLISHIEGLVVDQQPEVTVKANTSELDEVVPKVESIESNLAVNPVTVPTEVTGDGLTTLQGVSENVNTTPTTPIVTTTTTSGDNNDGGNSGTPINNGSVIPIPIKLVPSVEELKADINKLNNQQITLNITTNPSLDNIKTKIQEVANQGVGAGIPLDFSKIVPQTPVNINLNVTPSIESIKTEINSLSTEEHPAAIKISSNAEEIKNIKDRLNSIKDKTVKLTVENNIADVKTKFDTIKNKDVTLDIKFGESKFETVDNIKQSLDNLSGVDASSFSSSFKTLTSDITSQSKQQVTSIKEVVSALSELEKKLSSAGFKKVSDATAITKEFAKLQKQEDNIKKKQEKVQTSLDKKEAAIKKKEEKLQQREAKEEERRQKAETVYQNKLASVKAKEEKVKQDQALLKENQKLFKEQQKLEKEKMKAKSVMVDEDGELIDKKGIVQSLYNAAGNTSLKDKKNFSIVSKSARVDDYGVLRFKAYLEDAAGNIQKFAYQVDDINNIITNGGSLNANFLKRSGTNLDVVEATKQATLNAIAKQKTFDATNHYGMDQTDFDNQSKQYADEAVAAEQQLLNLLKSAKLEESEKLAIQKEITDAKQQEAKVLTANTMKAEQQVALMKSQDKFNHLFGGLNTSDDISSQFLNKTINLDGQEVNLQDVVANLKNESQSMLDALQNGAFESVDAFKNLNSQLNRTLNMMAQISSSENMISSNASQLLQTIKLTTKDGEDRMLSDIRNSTKQKMIYDELAGRYGQSGLKVGDYSDDTGANVRFIDDGVVKSATVYFEEYTAAVDQNTQALSANADASQKVNMASMRMSRIKTQNTTVKSVMNEEAINKVNIAASKTKDFEIVGKPFVDEDGLVRFVANVKMADGEVRELKYSIEDLNKAITTTGKFKASFLKTGTITADINAQVEATKAAINKQKVFDATTHYGMTTEEINVASQANKNAAAEAEKELKVMMDASNLTAKEKLKIERQITAEKEKQIQVLKVENMSSVQQNALKRAKDNYAKYFGDLETDDDVKKKFLDKTVNIDDEEVNLQDRIVMLRNQAKSMLEAMHGTFKTSDEFKKLSNQITEVYEKIKQLNSISNTKNGIFGSVDTKELFNKNNLSELTNLEKVQMIKQAYKDKGYKILRASNYSNSKDARTDLDVGSTIEYVDNDGKIVKATVSLENYTAAMHENKDAANENAEAIEKMGNVVIRTTKTKIGDDNLSFSQKWITGMKHKIGNLTQYLTGMGIIMRGVHQIREGFAFVKELDANMTTIYQTMDITTKGLEELSSRSIEASKNLGAVATEMLNSVNIYAAYGKTVDEIINQATPTVMLANASGAGAEQASDYIQAVVQQYEELEGQETKIVNAYEKIAANVQIDFSKAVQGISEGVQVAGSIMNEAGVEFETYAASLAKIVEKTRTDGSQVGNALKTIASRISRSSSGDEDVSEEDRSKASAAYSSVGISVYNDDGSYRGLSTILDELSAKWDDLTDAQRNYIAEQSAGVRNINMFNTMLDTWNEAKQLAADANEDTDYYMEVQEKWMESMTAKMNTLKATMQEFWYNLIDVGVINFGIDLLTNLLGVVEGIVNAFKNIGSAFGDIGGQAGGLIGVFTVISTAATLWTSMTKKLVTTNKNGQTMIASAGVGGLVDGIKNLGKEAAVTWSMFTEGAKGAYDGTTGLIPGIKSVWVNLGKVGKTLVGVSATVATLWVAAKVFDTLTTSSKEAAEAAKEASDAYKESQSSLKSNRQTINEIGLEYNNLSDGVDQFGNNISLTAEEFDKYHEICNKIADMYPNLVKSYDEQGNAILKLKGKVEELNAEYEKQQLNAARKNVSSLGAYIEDTKNITGNRSGLTEFVDMIGDWGDPDVGGQITNKEAVEILEKIQKMSNDEFKKFFSADYNDNEYDEGARYIASDELMNIGFWEGMYLTDENVNSKEFEERINTMRDKIPELLAKYTSEINDKAANVKTGLQDLIKIMQLDPDSYPEFKNADTTVFDRAKNLISSMTIDQIDKFMAMGDETEIENAFRKYVYDIVSVLNSNEDAKLSLDNILGLNEESSIEDIKKALGADLEKLSEALGIDKIELKAQLSLEDEEELIRMYNNTLESASEIVSNKSRAALGELYEDFKDNVTSLSLSTRTIDPNKFVNKNSNIKFDGEQEASFNTETFVSDDATKAIVVTPVLPDGTVLSDEELKEYAQKLLNGETIDADIKVAAFDGKDAEKQAKIFADRLKKASRTYVSVANASKRVKEFMKEQNINTTNEIALLQKCVDETDSWAEAMRKFKLESVDLKLNDEIIAGLESNLELVQTTIENIDDAAKSSYDSMGLNKEQIENIKNAFSDLDGFDYDQLFESSAEGVRLNAQELDRLNGEYEKFQKAKYSDTLDKLEREYSNLCIAINDAETATERINLINTRDGILEQIQKVQELESRYEGLTNAVTNYKRAKELGEEGDTFLEIQGDLEDIEELWNHGLVGTNQFKAAVQMMTNKDMAGASVEDYVNTYKNKIEQFKSWMTEDASGLQTFLYDLQDLGMASVDGDGFWSIDGNIQKMSEGLGTSQALIQEIFKRLKDFGFDVDFEEETNHLKNLKEEAIAARDAITKEEYKLNLDVKGEDALKEQIELGKKLIDKLDDGSEAYEQVRKQLDYLQAKAGETADAMNFNLNYTDNKDEIDSVITKLRSLEKYKDVYINFENVNIGNVEGQIENIKSELDKLKDPETGKIDFKVTEGANELADILIALNNKKIELTNTSAILKLDYHNLESDYAIVAEKLQAIKNVMNEIDSLEAQAALGVDISEDKEKLTGDLNNLIAELNTGTDTRNEVLISMGFDVSKNETIKENMQTVLDGLTAEKLVEIGFITPEQAKAELGYVVADAEKNVEIKILEAEWAAWKADADKDRTTNLHVKTIRDEYDEFIQEISNTRLEQKVTFTTDNSGISTPTSPVSSTQVNVNGNANVYGNARTGLFKKGSAFARGTWGAAKSGMSLVGELGRELVKLLPV